MPPPLAVTNCGAAFGGDLLGGQHLGVIVDDRGWALAIVLGGVALFVLVAAIQLVRFRQLNGVWLGGPASRVVLGTAPAASMSYALALGGSIWGAFNGRGGSLACARSRAARHTP